MMIKKQLQKILKHRFLLKLLIRPVEEGSKSSKIYFVNVDPKSSSQLLNAFGFNLEKFLG
jgi:hypothetical protein